MANTTGGNMRAGEVWSFGVRNGVKGLGSAGQSTAGGSGSERVCIRWCVLGAELRAATRIGVGEEGGMCEKTRLGRG